MVDLSGDFGGGGGGAGGLAALGGGGGTGGAGSRYGASARAGAGPPAAVARGRVRTCVTRLMTACVSKGLMMWSSTPHALPFASSYGVNWLAITMTAVLASPACDLMKRATS